MVYEWSEAKRQMNLAKHGVHFSAIESFQWEDAFVESDVRKHYGEKRYRALGPVHGRLHAAAFTLRGGNVRIISLRKANKREERKWQKK